MSATEQNVRASDLEMSPSFIKGWLAMWMFTRMNRWTVLGFLLLIPLMTITIDVGSQSQFIHLVLEFYQRFLLPIYCLTIFGPLIRDEVQSDTIGFLITRPISRAKLVLLKYLVMLVKVQILAFAAATILLLVGVIRGVMVEGLIVPFFISQAVAIFAYGGIATLFGLFSKKYMVLGMIYGGVVEFSLGRIPTNVQLLSMFHHMKGILAHSEPVRDVLNWEAAGFGISAAYTLGAGAIALVLSMLLFTVREYHHADDMQK